MADLCPAVGCDKPVIARGLCPKHYWRMRTHGTLDINSPYDLTIEERFWAKVDKTGACWMWTAGRFGDGYGAFTAHRAVRAHRFSYEIHHGPIPDGMVVMHTCDVPLCVNPDHLTVGTSAENSADAARKSRRPRGEKNVNAKLREVQVREIRLRYAAGGITQKELAAEYGVSCALISVIVTRKAWRHI